MDESISLLDVVADKSVLGIFDFLLYIDDSSVVDIVDSSKYVDEISLDSSILFVSRYRTHQRHEYRYQ